MPPRCGVARLPEEQWEADIPRNGAGVFAVLNPILVGALRSSSKVNQDFTDMGDEITNTLPIDGQAGMTGQLKAADGSQLLPGIGFANDTNTGFRRTGIDGMAWVGGGQDRATMDADGELALLGASDVAGAFVQNGPFTGTNDVAALEALASTGLTRRIADNTWSQDDGTTEIPLIWSVGGSVLPTGIIADMQVPFACTITGVALLADQSGSIVVDIWKDTYANYPPTVADTITASAKPTLSSATKYTDTTLTGWTTALAAGDILRFNLDSISTITRLAIILKVRRYP